ncbi:esterase family protein [Gordonia sp. TBRC 11910]|uniref:Esterase family protein n=2 Tax=Gordonia asplenii TaxID=2725283 RepID=A0A848KWW0_9ACTN|nr:esterase family protein [Gordonia asplenii]
MLAILSVTGTVLFTAPTGSSPAATLFPQAQSASDGSRIVSVKPISNRRFVIAVYSAAMRRAVSLQVIRPSDTTTPAPTMYMLDGAEDGWTSTGGTKTWESETDLVKFVADKHVNVVTVIDGAYSYYTDWLATDPVLGRNKWQTFLTRELPSVLDSAFDASGRNAIVGVSMSATSVLQLAQSAPGLYRSVGSFSGCSDLDNRSCTAGVAAVLALGRADIDNMWGPMHGKRWVAEDPGTSANLAKLRGTNLFFASGSGLPGNHDNVQSTGNDLVQLGRQLVIGGGPEAVIAQSNRRIQKKLAALGIAATFRFTPAGTHSWGYWQDDLHAAWPSFAKSLGVPTTQR